MSYANAPRFRYESFELVYVTNTTVETKIRVKVGVSYQINQSDSADLSARLLSTVNNTYLSVFKLLRIVADVFPNFFP